jgi:ribonucleotide monophosphatase NagD (HAD superfamily)
MTQKVESLKQIAAKYKNYFFDLDGVIVIMQ